MITESMRLNSMTDARQWAGEFGIADEEGEYRLAMWIWERKPYVGVAYDDHPISLLSAEEFWEICEKGYLTLPSEGEGS